MHTYEFDESLLHAGANDALLEGVIIKKTTGQYTVRVGGQLIVCDSKLRDVGSRDNREKRKLARQGTPGQFSAPKQRGRQDRLERRGANPPREAGVWDVASSGGEPVVGDLVTVRILNSANGRLASGRITTILPRRNKLGRRAAGARPGGHASEQVIVANVDRMVAVFAAAQPAPKWSLLDRYLVSAEAAGLPTLICLTKTDLAQDTQGQLNSELQAALDIYRSIGYPVIVTSVAAGLGLQALRQVLGEGVSVLVGKSGVGKTSLLNALQPDLGLRVAAVSLATEKGRHTTSHLEMFMLDGGALVDTPGIREFGLWDIEEYDLALHFPEMRPYIGKCKFGLDCRHDEEPGCAVRQAVMAGAISPLRYKSLQRLRQDE